MTIETKYDPTDSVWFICEDEVMNKYILRGFIETFLDEESTLSHEVFYEISGIRNRLPESRLFPTKEALIESL